MEKVVTLEAIPKFQPQLLRASVVGAAYGLVVEGILGAGGVPEAVSCSMEVLVELLFMLSV